MIVPRLRLSQKAFSLSLEHSREVVFGSRKLCGFGNWFIMRSNVLFFFFFCLLLRGLLDAWPTNNPSFPKFIFRVLLNYKVCSVLSIVSDFNVKFSVISCFCCCCCSVLWFVFWNNCMFLRNCGKVSSKF